MPLSRAELQAMDRDELVDAIVTMDERLRHTQEVLFELVRPAVDDLDDDVEALRADVARLSARVGEANGKDQKVRAIVRFAENKREPGQPVVKVTPAEVKGATGCSRRWSYSLVDDLPDDYEWLLSPDDMRTYGSLEREDDRKVLGVDFDGVHSTGVPVHLLHHTEEASPDR